MRIGILGGGISGVALQRFLAHPSEVLEAGPTPGGLCRTFWKDGFGYDIGGHILFSKLPEINQLVDGFLGENINRCRRANKVLFKGRYVKYPFENDLASLDKEDRYECLIGYLKADFPKPDQLRGVDVLHVRPGNRRQVSPPLQPQDLEDRAAGDGRRVGRAGSQAAAGRRGPIGPGNRDRGIHAPALLPLPAARRHRGAGAVDDRPEARRSPAAFACGKIRREGGGWLVGDGRDCRRFDEIVVAFPIHEAVHCFADVPEEVQAAVAGLRYNAIYIVMLAVNNSSLMDKSAIYIPDPEVLPHRVCYMGFFSPNMVRPGTSSLIAEITCRPGDAIDRSGKRGRAGADDPTTSTAWASSAAGDRDRHERPPRRIRLSGLQPELCFATREISARLLRFDRRTPAGPICGVRVHQHRRMPAAGRRALAPGDSTARDALPGNDHDHHAKPIKNSVGGRGHRFALLLPRAQRFCDLGGDRQVRVRHRSTAAFRRATC